MLNKFKFFAFIVVLLISKIAAADDVTVYVWQKQGANVGHVSLSTTRSYISLWPQDGFDPSQGQLHAPAVNLLNYDADKRAEGGDAHNKYQGNLMKRQSIKRLRKMAGWSDDILSAIISHSLS